jgi:hypothetical protein
MRQYYTLGKNFNQGVKRIAKSPLNVVFKSEKVILCPKAKELITKYRKGQIWKDI